MPYYGPRVGPGPIENIGPRIASAFQGIEERKLREKENERRRRLEDLQYDVAAAQAIEQGLVPEGVERLPAEPRVSGRDMIESGERTARQAADVAGGIAQAFGGPDVGAMLRQKDAATGQARQMARLPEPRVRRPMALREQLGPVPDGGRGAAPEGGETEMAGLPPGDVRAPLGTEGPELAGSVMDALTIREGQRAGYELPTGTEYRPRPAERDTLVSDIMASFGVSPEEARVLASKLGPSVASTMLREQDSPRDVSVGDLVAVGVPENIARTLDNPWQRVQMFEKYSGRPPSGGAGGGGADLETQAGVAYYQYRLQGMGRREAIQRVRSEVGTTPSTMEISRAEDDLAQGGFTERGLRERFGEPRTKQQQAFLDIMSLPDIDTPYQALQAMRDRGIPISAELEEYARGVRSDLMEEITNTLMLNAGLGRVDPTRRQ